MARYAAQVKKVPHLCVASDHPIYGEQFGFRRRCSMPFGEFVGGKPQLAELYARLYRQAPKDLVGDMTGLFDKAPGFHVQPPRLLVTTPEIEVIVKTYATGVSFAADVNAAQLQRAAQFLPNLNFDSQSYKRYVAASSSRALYENARESDKAFEQMKHVLRVSTGTPSEIVDQFGNFKIIIPVDENTQRNDPAVGAILAITCQTVGIEMSDVRNISLGKYKLVDVEPVGFTAEEIKAEANQCKTPVVTIALRDGPASYLRTLTERQQSLQVLADEVKYAPRLINAIDPSRDSSMTPEARDFYRIVTRVHTWSREESPEIERVLMQYIEANPLCVYQILDNGRNCQGDTLTHWLSYHSQVLSSEFLVKYFSLLGVKTLGAVVVNKFGYPVAAELLLRAAASDRATEKLFALIDLLGVHPNILTSDGFTLLDLVNYAARGKADTHANKNLRFLSAYLKKKGGKAGKQGAFSRVGDWINEFGQLLHNVPGIYTTDPARHRMITADYNFRRMLSATLATQTIGEGSPDRVIKYVDTASFRYLLNVMSLERNTPIEEITLVDIYLDQGVEGLTLLQAALLSDTPSMMSLVVEALNEVNAKRAQQQPVQRAPSASRASFAFMPPARAAAASAAVPRQREPSSQELLFVTNALQFFSDLRVRRLYPCTPENSEKLALLINRVVKLSQIQSVLEAVGSYVTQADNALLRSAFEAKMAALNSPPDYQPVQAPAAAAGHFGHR